MGERTFSEMKTDLQVALGNRDDNVVTAAWRGARINAAYVKLTSWNRLYDIKKRLYFPELEVDLKSTQTASGVRYVSVPSDCLIIRRIRDRTNNTRLKKMTLEEWAETKKGTSSDWTYPQKYLWHNNRINLYPTPDDEYGLTIYYRKRVTLLSSDSDTTVIGDEWDDVILQMAEIDAHLKLNELDRYKLKKEELLENLRNLSELYFEQDKDEDNRITPTYELTDREGYL